MILPLQINYDDFGANGVMVVGGGLILASVMVSALLQALKDLRPEITGQRSLECLYVICAVVAAVVVAGAVANDPPDARGMSYSEWTSFALSTLVSWVIGAMNLVFGSKGVYHTIFSSASVARRVAAEVRELRRDPATGRFRRKDPARAE